MKTVVKDEKELGEALKKEALEIEIEKNSKTGKTVIKIKAVGHVAWGVCAAAFTIAVTAVILALTSPPPQDYGGSSADYGIAEGIPLGVIIAVIAIAIGVIGGGIALLNKFRKYKMKERDGKIILTKK